MEDRSRAPGRSDAERAITQGGQGVPSRAIAWLLACATAAILVLAAGATRAEAAGTVTMRGNAYAFIFAGNQDRLEGAKIGIAEIPGLTTMAGPNGAYSLEVPDDTTITPYAEFAGYYTTHVQTFHTSGQDLTQVNFQMPALSTYNLLAGYVQAAQEPDGKLSKCGIVSTFFQKEGRSFTDFDDFHDFRPHGVIGSTATATPDAGRQFYFNSQVLPDPEQESSSRDGGVLWVDVDTGVYEIVGSSDTTRHSRFIATCEPGRLVNANPPWGLFELAGNEAINPAVLPDTELHARVTSASVRWGSGRRILKVRVDAREPVRASLWLRQGKRQVRRRVTLQRGVRMANAAVPARILGGRSAGLRVVLRDTAGNAEATSIALNIPRPRR
jgi:hypothetical protein